MAAKLRSLTLTAALALTASTGALAENGFDQARAAKDAAQLALFERHAGEPKDHVTFQSAIDNYEVVGPYTVIVWESRRKAWLVDLKQSDACRDLDSEPAARLRSMHPTLNVKNSYLEAGRNMSCKVVQIREVDVEAVQADQRGGVLG